MGVKYNALLLISHAITGISGNTSRRSDCLPSIWSAFGDKTLLVLTIIFGTCSMLLQLGLHCKNVIKALCALSILGINAPADLMEAAIANAVNVFSSVQGGYRDVPTMAIWSDPYCSRLQMLRGLGHGLDPNAMDCNS